MPAPHDHAVASVTDPEGPHEDDGTARRRGRWLSRRTLPALVVVGVLLLSAVVLLTRPGGTMQGAVTQPVVPNGDAAVLQQGTAISQDVLATQDDLTAVTATFGTFLGVTDCAIDVSVVDDRGSTVADDVLRCDELADNAPTTVAVFDPVPDSAGRTFTVRYTAAPGDWSQAVVLWVGEPADAALPATAEGDPATVDVFEDGDVATVTVAEYRAPSVWSQMWRAAGLASVGAPWWGQPVAQAVWAVLALGCVVGVVAFRRTRTIATVLLVGLALARGLLWATLVPPLEGMDEGAHITYVQYLAEQGTIPVRGEPLEDARTMYSEQLSVLDEFQNRQAMSPGDRAAHDDEAVAELEAELADASAVTNGQAPGTGYPPAYYAPAALVYDLTPGTLLDKLYAVRLWSVALGGLAAWATMAAARRLFPRGDLTSVLLGLAVTMQPMMAHQFAIVNNDGLAITAGIAALAVALRAASGHAGWRTGLLGGLAVGAALLAKPYGVGVLPVVAVGLLIGAWRGRRRLRDVLLSAAGGLGGLAVTYGAWTVAQLLFGVPSTALPSDPGGDQSRGGRHYVELQLAHDMGAIRANWGEQLFGVFAWLDVRLPRTTYDLIWDALRLLVVLAAVWLAVSLIRAVLRKPVVEHDLGDGLGVTTRIWLAGVAVLGVLLALYAAGYLYFRSAGVDELLQGRYALMMLPALLALPALLVESFTAGLGPRVRRYAPLGVMAAVATSMWALQVLSFATIANRFYL